MGKRCLYALKTGCARWQLHGVKKGDLKHVIASIARAGGSTLGGCGTLRDCLLVCRRQQRADGRVVGGGEVDGGLWYAPQAPAVYVEQ